MRRIGIDVGGTNTDAVLIDGERVVLSIKQPTTADVTGGIVAALTGLARQPGVVANLDAVMVGTTRFINAVVQGSDLARVGGLRIGSPATETLPPFCDWPSGLAAKVRGGTWLVRGGHDYDGRSFLPLDRAAVRAAGEEMAGLGLTCVSVAGMFSPLDPSHEEEAAAILRDTVPGMRVVCSHKLGRIGLIERENAALLNAALLPLADHTVAAIERALRSLDIAAPLYITQNDGTVAEARHAAAFPIFSFASGATNSMRGAAFLSGMEDAVVADVGGTTTDLGFLERGFPRQANGIVEVGGVRTLYRMPDVVSIGLGGGSLVDLATSTVGPKSVGFRLPDEAMVFGGDSLTMTDIAVSAGLMEVGDPARVAAIGRSKLTDILAVTQQMVEREVDRLKTRAGDVPLIAVGGASQLIPDRPAGVSRVIRVEHGDCANAVGAAIADVSGEIDHVFQDRPREAAMAEARQLAEERAVQAGADPETLRVVESEDIPIAYLPGHAFRVRVRVIGGVGAHGGAPPRP